MKRFTAALVLIAVSALFMAYGAHRGEIDEYYKKAVMICMECIGIG